MASNSPINAINKLVLAYNNEDLPTILSVRDFRAEAKLLLSEYKIKTTDTLIEETAEALQLSLIKNIQEKGFPYFHEAKRTYKDLKQINHNLFRIQETIHAEGNISNNEIFLTNSNEEWKIALVKSMS